ncbi:MAG: TrkH family potassium uptake protein [Spirochaetales bacterium]|nr:TrkH family potassium uptake protein [Spirochaetales bacterium]
MKKTGLIIITVLLSVTSLLIYSIQGTPLLTWISRIIDIIIIFFLYYEIIIGISSTQYPLQYIIKNKALIIFSIFYSVIITILTIRNFHGKSNSYFNIIILAARSLFLLFRIIKTVNSLEELLRKLNERPARSIVASFLIIITTGTILLMLPFSSTNGHSLNFIDAFFTATSAVCVTGLIVVDTATAFSITGKIIILLLIQTGGLGIMILTYFSSFILGRRVSLEEKQRLMLVLSNSDLSDIVRNLKKIIYLTFSIEGIGAILLFIEFSRKEQISLKVIFSSIFHSISAFCNAGFSLYSDSLEGFKSSPAVIFTISALIILGGLSFSVIFNFAEFFKKEKKLSLNSKVVLIWTGILLGSGFILFYATEHINTLYKYNTPTQYLSAFFQSVTLRTAGFNSVSFSGLRSATLVFMCFFMFIGAASGSTAGGIKVNTIAVIFAYIKSMITNSPKTKLYQYQLSQSDILKAYALLQYGILAVFAGTFALALTHSAPLKDIIFETVSAFGTVGVSTGLTSQLNTFGKIIIIMLMYTGRLGPLTILSVFSSNKTDYGIEYPEGNILIG